MPSDLEDLDLQSSPKYCPAERSALAAFYTGEAASTKYIYARQEIISSLTSIDLTFDNSQLLSLGFLSAYNTTNDRSQRRRMAE